MKERALTVRLRLAGPVLTRATAMGDYGVDAPVARASNGDGRGRPILPGSLIKGKLRDAWRELAAAAPAELAPALGERGERIAEWLGEQNDRGRWEPRRARLRFADLEADRAGGSGRRYRVQLDRKLGAVRPTALQAVESPFAPGEEVEFAGEIRLVARGDAELEALRRAVEAGLRWTPSFGGMRGSGFGRLLAATVTVAPAPTVSPAPASSGDRLALAYTIGAPFCLAAIQPVDNLFVSAVELSGGAIKGALAATWNERLGRRAGEPIAEGCDPERAELARHFSRLRFTHAFPARRTRPLRRPVTPPLSLVWAGKGEAARLGDALRLGEPALFADGDGRSRAPAFAVDWKPGQRRRVRDLYGWAAPATELRVRTAIDPATRRAAEAQLFAYETVVPGEDDVWLGTVDLGDLPEAERAAAREQLVGLLADGLQGLGKTKARVAVEVCAAGGVEPSVPGRADGGGRDEWAVALQTPALLCDPDRLAGASGREGLRAAFAEVFAELAGGALELAEGGYFAAQRLAGGHYLWRRFLAGRRYRPLLLTEAGSVFLLRAAAGRRDEAADRVRAWARHGLPLPTWVRDRLGAAADEEEWALWDRCPYLRYNGFGEVALDLGTPPDGAPAAATVEPIGWGTP